ncbi:hypothetical protein INR77_08075 [Erythrobacter sp. SCSIO 43205]|nr:hypothetical protein INR77_08075 [Erythrobacter sp. SCSIO 43205]
MTLALSVMGATLIAAATDGRLWVGIVVGLGVLIALALLASALGLRVSLSPVLTILAAVLASLSFAARGSLFARSAEGRGWLIALGVLAGESAVVLSSLIDPDLWPGWLLALLPAQWASLAFKAALTGTTALAPLLALGGTAMATLFVVQMWPRRWTYGIMFGVWLGLSALVYHTNF